MFKGKELNGIVIFGERRAQQEIGKLKEMTKIVLDFYRIRFSGI